MILKNIKGFILVFLASLSLYLVLFGASYFLLSYLRSYILKSANFNPRAITTINYFIAIIYLLIIIVLVFIFSLIGKRVNLKRDFLPIIFSLILGSYIGSLIEVLVLQWRIISIIDVLIGAFLRIFIDNYYFFLVFTGIAIGYIKPQFK